MGLLKLILENGAKKIDNYFVHLIVDTAKLLFPNSSENDIRLHKGDCWHHLRNVWKGSSSTHFSKKLSYLLEQDLDKMNSILHITTILNDFFHAVDKEFNFTSNYPKSHGEMIMA